MARLETVADLKKYLQNVIEKLEDNYNNEDKLNVYTNTYFCNGDFISITRQGFIDIDDPVEKDDEDEDDDSEEE